MGIVLIASVIFGIATGSVVSELLVVSALLLTRMQIAGHSHVWRTFALAMGSLLPVLWFVAYLYCRYQLAWESDSGTSGPPDFSRWFQNLYVSGLAFAASPGLAAMLAFVAVLVLSPRKLPPPSP
ncbi:MAG: hypothetical protein MUC60_09935 [Oscillatoria sp. Prado101]|jgi:hypothetical protein|nr:hypothetical protein [Oscillatoria sp. Prado101]